MAVKYMTHWILILIWQASSRTQRRQSTPVITREKRYRIGNGHGKRMTEMGNGKGVLLPHKHAEQKSKEYRIKKQSKKELNTLMRS